MYLVPPWYLMNCFIFIYILWNIYYQYLQIYSNESIDTISFTKYICNILLMNIQTDIDT